MMDLNHRGSHLYSKGKDHTDSSLCLLALTEIQSLGLSVPQSHRELDSRPTLEPYMNGAGTLHPTRGEQASPALGTQAHLIPLETDSSGIIKFTTK